MQLSIRHETVYRYTAPLSYTIQQLRVSPRIEPQQHVLSWRIATVGNQHQFIDAFDNVSHMLTITGLHDEVRIAAEGVVEVSALDRGRLAGKEIFSPLVFTVPTRLTVPSRAVHEFAARHLHHDTRSHALLTLAEAIRDNVAYQSGATEVTTTASDALHLGQGVCQDHAHLFLACCHAHNIPVRYVSGYIDPGDTSHAASHAWVDVWVEESDFSGWVSIDVTHARYADESHCRLAIGRDYDSAAPVRGVRHGGGTESLSVNVQVSSSQAMS
ncbi:transglutaminase family protein [Noviherbaspirillum cavernae]|uniref:Transglutaminase family protein n=1 Tax=Noviherbaspirillum cavernae TaxID=2320862 RepID=A0A418X5P0_9BURK|nr:transglutaminase family protein [Noviherbaspirillum cavernae]RJG07807.1 transglutaminase family protein [Noviherbaspirillum cavernae]